MRTIDRYESEWRKKRTPRFDIGDVVDVHVKITEGDKERIQVFTGTVIKKKGCGLSETFTVRRLVQGEGVERIFPVHSPRVAEIKVKKQGEVRRAKLYYLRDRIGRAAKVVEKIGGEIPRDEAPAEATSAEAAAATETAQPKAEEKAVAAETK